MSVIKKIRQKINRLPFINKYYSGVATIFMLHRVDDIDSTKLSANEEMKVSPKFLEAFILDLFSKNFTFVSLDDLYRNLKNKAKQKKQIVFTLDDGYKDNFEIAYPIFKKYNIPFTVYITTSFPEQNALLWWYILEDLIIENSVIKLPNGQSFSCSSQNEKIETFFHIRQMILSMSPINFEEQLKSLLSNYAIDWEKKCADLAMNWDQIRSLSKDPLVTIGSHTKNHLPLNRLSKNQVLKEIIEAKELIESKILKPTTHFSYPFGRVEQISDREFEIVRKLKIDTATTTRNGNIYRNHVDYLECLPRIWLVEGFLSTDIGNIRRKKFVI